MKTLINVVLFVVLFGSIVPAAAQGSGSVDWWTVGVTIASMFVGAVGTVATIVVLIRGNDWRTQD